MIMKAFPHKKEGAFWHRSSEDPFLAVMPISADLAYRGLTEMRQNRGVSDAVYRAFTRPHMQRPLQVSRSGDRCAKASHAASTGAARETKGATEDGMLHVMMPKQRALPCDAWEGPCQSGNIDRPVGRAQLALSDDATATRSMFC